MSHMIANPRGRQPIAVNQPPGGGSLYPFVNPSPDILYLLGDFFVSFDDLEDQYTYPLRVAWLYGFGTNVVPPPPGSPAPTHSHDLIVVDADDRVVFNSTVAENFTATPWDDRLLVLEWTNADRVCRCSMHTAWTQADIDDDQTITYDNYILPENGELQADCWYKLPKRVTSIRVGLNYIAQQPVQLAEGYNIGLTHSTTTLRPTINLAGLRTSKSVVAGTRVVNRVVIDAVPGNGLGTAKSLCNDHSVRTINKTAANDYSNFNLDTYGCVRTKRPVVLTDTSPRKFIYRAVNSKGQTILDPIQSKAALAFGDNCKNCCDCTYFAQTYQGLKRQWFLYRDVGRQAEQARDIYESNRSRWLIQKELREQVRMNLRLMVDGDSKIRWGLSFCNASKCCLMGMRVYMCWLAYTDATPLGTVPFSYDCPPAMIDGISQCDGPATILPTSYPNLNVFEWDACHPQTVTTLSGRQCFPAASNFAQGRFKVSLYTILTWREQVLNPVNGQECIHSLIPMSVLPVTVQESLAEAGLDPGPIYAVQQTDYVPVNTSNPFCRRCNCE